MAFAAVADITEEDSSPHCFGWQLKFTNGSVTDNGDATCSVSLGAGAGDVTDVGDCATGACFTAAGTGTSLTPPAGTLTIVGSLSLSAATPTLDWTPSAGDKFESYASGSLWTLSNVTDGQALLQFDGAGSSAKVFLPTYNCSTKLNGGVLTVDSSGHVNCEDDDAGSGSNHNLLSATHPDTVVNAVSRGSLIYGNSTPAWDELVVGAANSALTSNGTDAAWSTTPTLASLTLATTAPSLALTPTAGDAFEWWANGSVVGLANTTDGQQLLEFDGAGSSAKAFLPTYGSLCSGKSLTVDASGHLNCETVTNATITLTGDVTGSGTSTIATTVATDAVALTTDTTGNYLQSLSCSANLSGCPVAAEGATGTLDTVQGIQTSSTPAFAGLTLSGVAAPNLVLTPSAGDSFELTATASLVTLSNTTDGQALLQFDGNGSSARAFLPTYASLCSGKANNGKLTVDGSGHLNCEADAGAASAGDVTDVGDCPTGACFTGASGTSLTPSGGTLTVVGALTLSATTPTLELSPTSGDKFELYADSKSEVYLVNETDGVVLLRGDASNNLYSERTWDFTKATLKGLPSREYVYPASSLEPLEAADSIPPITKTTGTNLDILTLSYDATTDEGRKLTFRVPSDVDTTGNVQFRLAWFSLTATSGTVVWDVRYAGTGTSGESWDQSLTTASVRSTAQGTTNQRSLATIEVSVSSLGWVAGDVISVMVYRDANHAADTMVGDAELEQIVLEVPLT